QWPVVAEAHDGLQAVEQVQASQPDCILMDIGLPQMNGLEASRRIRAVAPHARIIFVSQELSPEVVRAAIDLGARGFVAKARAGSDLVAAIESVSRGDLFLSAGLDGLAEPKS